MPVTQSAKKALRRDKRRTLVNQPIKQQIKEALKKARKNPTKKTLASANQVLDRAAKKHVIHKRKASRLKARLAKLVRKRKKKEG